MADNKGSFQHEGSCALGRAAHWATEYALVFPPSKAGSAPVRDRVG